MVPNPGLWLAAGDDRVNEVPSSTALTQLFALEHNRIALELAASDATINDETLFQEARRLNIAVYQKITTREVSR